MSRRILRLGNYTIQQTSAYSSASPPGTPSSWGTAAEVAAMDQSLTSTAGELTRQGVLITFQNTADFLSGGIVKVRPSYSGLELPFIEMWTHDSGTSAWTLRRRLSITNLLVGVRSGEFKIFDLRLFDDLDGSTIDMVWITMDPGAVGTPVMRFLAIHLFGSCNSVVVTPNPPGVLEPGDECVIDPEQCLDDPIDPNPDDVPPDEPPTFPTVDICDPEELEAFKAQLTPEQLAYFEELIAAAELPCPEDPSNNDPTDDPAIDPETGDPYAGPEPPAPVCSDFTRVLHTAGQWLDPRIQLGQEGADAFPRKYHYEPGVDFRLSANFQNMEQGMVAAIRITCQRLGSVAESVLLDDTGFHTGQNGEFIGQGDSGFTFDTPTTALTPGYMNFEQTGVVPTDCFIRLQPGGGPLFSAGKLASDYRITIFVDVYVPTDTCPMLDPTYVAVQFEAQS